MNHKLKIRPEFFQAIIEGRKNFEIRVDDRGYQAGDTVTLNEHKPDAPETCAYTGRTATYRIGYVSGHAQRNGFVVFSLLPLGEA